MKEALPPVPSLLNRPVVLACELVKEALLSSPRLKPQDPATISDSPDALHWSSAKSTAARHRLLTKLWEKSTGALSEEVPRCSEETLGVLTRLPAPRSQPPCVP